MHSKRPWKSLGVQNWQGEFPDGLAGAPRPSASLVASSSRNLEAGNDAPAGAEPGGAGLCSSENVERLARILQSEASVGNEIERAAVAWTVLNRMKRNATDHVRDVASAYATNQEATDMMRKIARDVLSGKRPDPTGGCTHYYSPRSMPKEDERTTGYDTGGGVELVPPLTKPTYRPGWVLDERLTYTPIPGVRPHFFMFYKVEGAGKVN